MLLHDVGFTLNEQTLTSVIGKSLRASKPSFQR